jgi:two-component system sensor histidine kinase AlgZ
MTSIKHALEPKFPDFRNLGVWLRALVCVCMLTIMAALLKARTWDGVLPELLAISTLAQPLALTSILLLSLFAPQLSRLRYRDAVLVALALECLLAGLFTRFFGEFALDRALVFASFSAAAILGYFDLRQRALSPAIMEARLQALQSRIRPHFLFNSLNAVLSLIRDDARTAERALQDLADLYRVAMADVSRLSTLAQEVKLARRYLDLEQLRLGERLKVEWHIDKMPKDACIPPLILQPLLENAVYHGIEPVLEPGTIRIHLYQRRERVHAVLQNPYRGELSQRAGNRLALANIAERLALHFDAEASIVTKVTESAFQVHITLPYIPAHEPAQNYDCR